MEHVYHPTLQALTINASIGCIGAWSAWSLSANFYIDWNIYIPARAVKIPPGQLDSPSGYSVRAPSPGSEGV